MPELARDQIAVLLSGAIAAAVTAGGRPEQVREELKLLVETDAYWDLVVTKIPEALDAASRAPQTDEIARSLLKD